MKKESFTEKLIKRTYGITGPLDEYKRAKCNEIGNIAFIWTFYVLIIGNAISFIFARRFPEIVAYVYPIILTIFILGLEGYIMYRIGVENINIIDLEEIEENYDSISKIKKATLKSSIVFGITLFLFNLIPLALGEQVSLIQTIFTSLISSLLWGIIMYLIAKSRLK